MPSFVLYEPLPKELVIPSSGDHFYKYGISLYSVGSVERSKLNNPIIVFIIPMITIIKSIISLSLIEWKINENILVLIGDWTHFLGVRVHANIMLILCSSFVIYSQFSHFINHRKFVKQTYLTPFVMLAGRVSPLTIGMRSANDVQRMVELSKLMFTCTRYISQSFAISGVIFASVLLFNMPSLFYIPVIGLHMTQLSMGGYFLGTSFTYQISYFYLIAMYFKLKIKRLNESLIESQSKPRINRLLIEILYENNWIHNEIYRSNDEFVSKFLFGIIFINGAFICFTVYVYLFVSLNLLMKNLCLYFAIIWSIIFIAILDKSSQIVCEKNKTYRSLNKLLYNRKLPLVLLLKVNYSRYE